MTWQRHRLNSGSGGWTRSSLSPEVNILFVAGISDASERILHSLDLAWPDKANLWTLDLKGFGESKGENAGHFGDLDGSSQILNDIVSLFKAVDPSLPTVLIGHSTGAIFTLLSLAALPTKPAALILSSVGLLPFWELQLARLLFGVQVLKHGKRGFSPWIEAQTQHKYQKELLLDLGTEWRSTDAQALQSLQDNPSCTQPASVESWREILKALSRVSTAIDGTDPPECLLLSGSHDPSTQFGVGTHRLAQALTQANWPCQHRFFAQTRHELWAGTKAQSTIETVRVFVQRIITRT